MFAILADVDADPDPDAAGRLVLALVHVVNSLCAATAPGDLGDRLLADTEAMLVRMQTRGGN